MHKIKAMKNTFTHLMMASAMMSGVFMLPEFTPKIKTHRGVRSKVRNSKENPKIGRNDLCLCGSGIKYKKCCNK